ncbi:MAG: hypothetical protein NXH90_11840 [Flavobacteriaceae bacterium]|nr:hypothetical protein [Flavobacteriaceae bacterium]
MDGQEKIHKDTAPQLEMVADRPCHHGGNTGTEGRTVGGPESGKRTIEDLALGRVSTILEVRSFTFLAIRALQKVTDTGENA